MPLHKHLFNYVSNRCLHKGTIENSESMFPKRKEGKKYQMTKECNCLPLKYILNSSTERLLERFVFVQVITKFDQNNKCFGGIVEHFSSSGIHGISHAWDLNAITVGLFWHTDTACLHLRGAHAANIVDIFVHYSWHDVHLLLKWTRAAWFCVSRCFLFEKNHCCHLGWLASWREGWVCLWSMPSVVSLYFNPWGIKSAFFHIHSNFSSVWSLHERPGGNIHLHTLRSGRGGILEAEPPRGFQSIWGDHGNSRLGKIKCSRLVFRGDMALEILLPSNIKLGLIQLGLLPFGGLWPFVKAWVCPMPKPQLLLWVGRVFPHRCCLWEKECSLWFLREFS